MGDGCTRCGRCKIPIRDSSRDIKNGGLYGNRRVFLNLSECSVPNIPVPRLWVGCSSLLPASVYRVELWVCLASVYGVVEHWCARCSVYGEYESEWVCNLVLGREEWRVEEKYEHVECYHGFG